MGNLLKLIGFGLAVIGIAISLWMPWWSAEYMGATMKVSLHDAEICGGGSCATLKVGGMYGIVAMMTMAYGALALLLIILGGFVPALAGDSTRPMAIIGGLIYLMLVGLTYGTMDPAAEMVTQMNIQTTWAFKAGIFGSVMAMTAPLLGFLDRRSSTPLAYKAPEVRDPSRAARISELPPMQAFPAPVRSQRLSVPPIAIDLEPQPPRPARTTASPMSIPLGEVRPRPSRSGLHFAVATAEIREESLTAIGEDGATREVHWGQLGGVLARELEADPPLGQTMLVDLVPTGQQPVRFLTTSRLAFPSGAADGGDPRDALRRLLAFVRAMHPEVELEAATTDYLYKRTELPTWSLDELARYDARYRR